MAYSIHFSYAFAHLLGKTFSSLKIYAHRLLMETDMKEVRETLWLRAHSYGSVMTTFTANTRVHPLSFSTALHFLASFLSSKALE